MEQVAASSVVITAHGTGFTKVIVEGDNPRSGVIVGPRDTGDGIVITNLHRRHLWYFIFRTGYRDQNDEDWDIPWEKLDHTNSDMPLVPYVEAVNSYSGVIGTLWDLIAGTMALQPVEGKPVRLSLEPADAKRTYYSIIVLGAAATGDQLVVPDPLLGTAYEDEVDNACTLINLLTWFQELVAPVLFTFLPEECFGQWEVDPLATALMHVMKFAKARALPWTEKLVQQDYKGLFKGFFKSMLDDEGFRKYVVNELIRAKLFMPDPQTMKAISGLWDILSSPEGLGHRLAASGQRHRDLPSE